MMPGISVPPAVSTFSPAKPANSPAGATLLDLAALLEHRLAVQHLLAIEQTAADIQRRH